MIKKKSADRAIISQKLDMYMYEVNSIKNIDLNHEHEADIRADNSPESIFGNNGSKIKFDYGMETVKFAKEVDEIEAKMIIEEMKKNSNFKEENFV